MIRLIFLFVILGAGLFVGTQYSGQQGYVLISIANTTIEMSVTTLILCVFALLAVLFALEFIIKKLLHVSFSTWNWFSIRKMRHSRRLTNEAILKLIEGDWKIAEKKAARWAKHHDMPLLCYLVAAEAAHGQGNKEKCEQYLQLAEKQENSELAVALTKAKQLIDDGDYQAAENTLDFLRIQHPNNNIALNLMKRAYIQLNKWPQLLELLPYLEKAKLIDTQQSTHLYQQAHCEMLKQITQQLGSDGIMKYWEEQSRQTRQDSVITSCFARLLAERKEDIQALSVIQETLKKQSVPELYALLPELGLNDQTPVIKMLQNNLKKDEHNAAAHSALANIYHKQERWAEAQKHLESALHIRPDISDYKLLAEVLDKQKMTKAAHDVSLKALEIAQKTQNNQ